MFSIVTDVFFFWNFGKSTEKTARKEICFSTTSKE
jgi:hypothetical protein